MVITVLGVTVAWTSKKFGFYAILEKGKFGEVQAANAKNVDRVLASWDRGHLGFPADPMTLVAPKVLAAPIDKGRSTKWISNAGWFGANAWLADARGRHRPKASNYFMFPNLGRVYVWSKMSGGGMAYQPIDHTEDLIRFPPTKHKIAKAILAHDYRFRALDLPRGRMYGFVREEQPFGLRLSLVRYDTTGKVVETELQKGLDSGHIYNGSTWFLPFADGSVAISYRCEREGMQQEYVLDLVSAEGKRRQLALLPSMPIYIRLSPSDDETLAIASAVSRLTSKPIAQVFDSQGRKVGPLFTYVGPDRPKTEMDQARGEGTFDAFIRGRHAVYTWVSDDKIHVATLTLPKR